MATIKQEPHRKGNFKDFDVNQKSIQISPMDLKITWGDDDRYWSVPKDGQGAAELYQVSWLEVASRVDKTDINKDYIVGFNISLTPDAFGWSGTPVYLLFKRGKGYYDGQRINLDEYQGDSNIEVKVTKSENNDSEDSKIEFGLYEVWSDKWKGGLKINHAFIRESS